MPTRLIAPVGLSGTAPRESDMWRPPPGLQMSNVVSDPPRVRRFRFGSGTIVKGLLMRDLGVPTR